MKKTANGIRRIVHSIIADVLGRDVRDISPKSLLVHDMGADDVDMAEILTCIEWELRIVIPDFDERHGKIKTVSRLCNRVLACYRRTHGRFLL